MRFLSRFPEAWEKFGKKAFLTFAGFFIAWIVVSGLELSEKRDKATYHRALKISRNADKVALCKDVVLGTVPSEVNDFWDCKKALKILTAKELSK